MAEQSKLVDLMEIALPRLYNAADAVTKSMGIAAASPYRADKGTAVQRKRSWVCNRSNVIGDATLFLIDDCSRASSSLDIYTRTCCNP